MGQARNWTPQELEYLSENWGKISVPKLAANLNRNESAIVQRAGRLGLGSFLEAGDYITLHQLLLTLTGSRASDTYKNISWIQNRGMPVHSKRVRNSSFKIVYLSEFWKWAEKNRSFIDWTKMEPLSLGKEPPWVAEQRKKDAKAFSMQRKDPWTPLEDQRLIHLLREQRYSYAEVSELLHRSCGAIQRRCLDLGIQERPVKADVHNPYTDTDLQILAEGIRRGASYMEIGQLVGRSEKAIRGKVFQTYRTEVADDIRAMLGTGPWGTGAPVATVWEARGKASTQRELVQLIMLLKTQRNEISFDGYWQKDMCLNWDSVKGCISGCTSCDDCGNHFQRISPQYCVRCGATFFERHKELRCPRCREQRRKSAARKYYAQRGGAKCPTTANAPTVG